MQVLSIQSGQTLRREVLIHFRKGLNVQRAAKGAGGAVIALERQIV